MTILTSNKELRKAIYTAFKGRCFYTTRELSENNFHIDHILPKAQGGEDVIDNYVLCCPEHNLRKGDRVDEDAIIGVLYYVKTVYAPKVRKEMGEDVVKTVKIPKVIVEKERPPRCVYGGSDTWEYEDASGLKLTDDIEDILRGVIGIFNKSEWKRNLLCVKLGGFWNYISLVSLRTEMDVKIIAKTDKTRADQYYMYFCPYGLLEFINFYGLAERLGVEGNFPKLKSFSDRIVKVKASEVNWNVYMGRDKCDKVIID